MKPGAIGLLLAFTFLSAQAQTKMELEKRISLEEVPQLATQWLDHYYLSTKSSKLKWYFEKDGDHYSYECKFKLHRHRFSVEFDQLGHFEDLEISYSRRQLPDEIYNSLQDIAKKYRIKRTQIQFKAIKKELFQPGFLNKISKSKTAYLYELEVILDGEFYELLMDSSGNILLKRPILSPTGIYLDF